MEPNIRALFVAVPVLIFIVALWALIFAALILLIRALWVYTHYHDKNNRPEIVAARKSLGETIKAHRTRCNMTQELVAERLGVSRQAVSKWESGSSDPSTTNLLALAKLFEVSPEELLRSVE